MSSGLEADWAQYIKASAEAFALLKTLYPLLPTQNRDEIEAKIEAAERALQIADSALWQQMGFKLHDCKYPPPMMFWKEDIKERVCSHCGYKTNFNRPLGGEEEDSYLSVRR
jgi:Zn ribbon nucleic-acid-binding protein